MVDNVNNIPCDCSLPFETALDHIKDLGRTYQVFSPDADQIFGCSFIYTSFFPDYRAFESDLFSASIKFTI